MYSQDTSSFVTVEEISRLDEEQKTIWGEALKEVTALVKIIEEYQKELKKKDPGFKMIDPRTASWSDVMKAIQEGVVHCETEEMSGPKGFLRHGFRKLGKNARIFESWLKFLPQENNYLSPLCASFHIILTIARRVHDVREEHLSALSSIEDDLGFIQEYLNIYPDRTLKESAAALYVSMLRVLQHVMIFFNKGTLRKAGRAFLKLDNYGAPFEDLVQQMNDCKSRFRDRAEVSLHRNVKVMGGMVARMEEDMARNMEELREERKAHNETKLAFNEATLAMNALSRALMETDRRRIDEMDYSVKLLDNGTKPSRLIEVMQQLGFDSAQADQDSLECLSYSVNFDAESIECLDWIKRSAAFQDWVIAPDSRILLIECDERTTLPTTYASFLCAEITHLISCVKDAVVLTYFGGLRYRSLEGIASAKGVMVSFLGQILTNWPAHWDTPRLEKVELEGPSEVTLSELYRAFRSVVSSFPTGSLLYILIDSIEYLELPDLRKKTQRMVRTLAQLCTPVNAEGGVIVKFLMTTPNRTTVVADYLGPENVLYVPDVRE